MEPETLSGNMPKLPEEIAKRLRGKTIRVTELEEGILLKPTDHSIGEARGFLKGRGFTSNDYFEMKQRDKDLEA